ncbi:MAG: nitroreductase family protein [Erysipelotrichaceae bacterium]|nr:nitroreductase family protein [Erysipelotrichaceae bacterium]
MNINFSIEEAVGKRVSVRNYTSQPIEDEKRTLLTEFLKGLENPFNQKVNFHFFDMDQSSEDQKLGTYGVIQKAKHFLGASIRPVPRALEALGYEMETVMLYLAHLDIGTCWLGGTFDRKGFVQALHVGENEILPAITPIGYAQSSRHLQEVLMRTFVQAHKRLEWSKLFFYNDFQTGLAKEQANNYTFALEMVRLAPSASNKQPWRILLKDGNVHFYEYKTPKYSDAFGYDIQRIDMGIAAAHFEHSVKELGMIGKFVWDVDPKVELPQHMEYVFSWIPLV